MIKIDGDELRIEGTPVAVLAELTGALQKIAEVVSGETGIPKKTIIKHLAKLAKKD